MARKQSVLRPRDVEHLGIAREYLLRLVRRGDLVRVGRGIYTLPRAKVTEHHSFAEVAKQVPESTICLLSSLAFYNLTTQAPHEVWIALPPGARTPRSTVTAIRAHRFSGKALTEGREKYVVEGVPVMIYVPAKTVADCFKFRNKIGIDVAMEALRESLRKKAATISEIRYFAHICRVQRVMRPYLDAI
ncbi:MAG TPA: type IV toxin-antitoxin system AbiEi family antitoxin domain-containing protein [Bryobacteraceae bacterium]|nr:type IV toxin-antitoxin system AbiEi family antitoxin domain-containing protein [Bryobacteraceae bacterium]